jgi:hypothetical protein
MRTAKLVSPDTTQIFSFTKVDDRTTAIRANTGASKVVQRYVAVDYYRALLAGGWKLMVRTEKS